MNSPQSPCCQITKKEIEKAIDAVEKLIHWRDPHRLAGLRLTRSILAKLGVIQKQGDVDLTTSEGFLEWAIALALDLRVADRTGISRRAEELRSVLNVNWPNLTAEQVDGVLAEVVDLVTSMRGSILEAQISVLGAAAHAISEDAKSDWAAKFSLGTAPAFTAADKEIEEFIVRSTANFIRARDGQLLTTMSTRARQVVGAAAAQGLGRQDIARMLGEAIGDVQTTGYYSLIAGQFVNSARSYGALRAMNEVDVELAEILAVLDEKTTDICRFLDGKFINVGESLGMIERLSKADNIERVKNINPWIREGSDDDGRFLYLEQDGKRVQIARVDRSGIGVKDDRGEFSDSLNTPELQVLGIGPPPYHGNCRTGLVPVIDEEV